MFERPFVGTPTDYSDPANWLKCPSKEEAALPVDVIYLVPSSCMDPEAGKICAVDNASLRMMGTANYVQTGSCFEGVGNIYFPWWRQVNGALLAGMSFEEVDELEYSEPRTDVYAALDYYFENFNDGKPYIIAGHSQGSRLASMVLAEYMQEYPERYARMIACYRVGDGLTREYLEANPHVIPAAAADDLGVCASWNTEGPANLGAPSLVVPPNCVCINPLNWRTDEEPASANLNLGCMIPNIMDGSVTQIDGIANARVDLERGSVIVDAEECKQYSITAQMGDEFAVVFGPESYHLCDYGFFYFNIRENAKLRVQKWFEVNGE